ncbi:MAG TPA: CocE/NonD family hydrolase [Actinomycetota bacterium]|nr:CocE/NonD family hydrolase [Actinomycetota bacterium]
MRRLAAVLIVGLTAALLAPAPAHAARPGPIHGYIPMSDGVTLKYQALLPDPDRWGPGPYPMVMDYSGYIPGQTIYDGLHHRFLEAGYAIIGLNIRGTHCSGGYFDYFEPRQALDGKEAVEWLTGHRETPGFVRPAQLGDKLAMVGKSYPGITQLFVAAQQPKGLAAIVPGHVFGDLYRDVPFPGGILNATFAGAWSGQRAVESMASGYQWWAQNQGDERCLRNQPDHLPNTAFNPFVQALYNQFDGPLFWERSPWWWADRIDVPTMLVQSWQDEQVGSRATHLIDRLRPGLHWRFLSSNGDHGEYYGEEMLPHIYRFLEFALRGRGHVVGDFGVAYGYEDAGRASHITAMRFPDATADEYWAEDPVIINFDNGAKGGRKAGFSRTFSSWPPLEVEADRLFLKQDGSLSEEPHGPAALPTKVEAANARALGAVDYAYVPVAGTQERGGHGISGVTPGDWTRKPASGTYAAFTSAPLSGDQLMLGTASVDLFISSTAPDTDLEVTLTEVRPDGKEVFVQKGWLRASHRMEDPRFSTELRPFQSHRLGDSAPLVPGHPTLARVEIFPFGHAFRAGSQIRIWVSAPNLLPDLWGFASLPTPAVNSIYTSGIYPSSVAFPVIRADVPTDAPPCSATGREGLRNQPCR